MHNLGLETGPEDTLTGREDSEWPARVQTSSLPVSHGVAAAALLSLTFHADVNPVAGPAAPACQQTAIQRLSKRLSI